MARLEQVCPGLSTLLVLLTSPPTNPAPAFKDSIAHERNAPLAGDHVTPFCGNNAAHNRAVGHLLEGAAGPGKSG